MKRQWAGATVSSSTNNVFFWLCFYNRAETSDGNLFLCSVSSRTGCGNKDRKHWLKLKRLNPILNVTLSLLYTETLQDIRHPTLKTTDRQWEYSWPGIATPRIRSGTFLRLVELEFLLVVPSQCRFVLSVRLHTKLTPKALHIVCKHTHTQYIFVREPCRCQRLLHLQIKLN